MKHSQLTVNVRHPGSEVTIYDTHPGSQPIVYTIHPGGHPTVNGSHPGSHSIVCTTCPGSQPTLYVAHPENQTITPCHQAQTARAGITDDFPIFTSTSKVAPTREQQMGTSSQSHRCPLLVSWPVHLREGTPAAYSLFPHGSVPTLPVCLPKPVPVVDSLAVASSEHIGAAVLFGAVFVYLYN